MKCPKCGAEMKEGSLYCEQCGEDIHIVPDFEPELEYNLEQTLSDIVKEISSEKSNKTIDVGEKQSEIQEEVQQEEFNDKQPSKHKWYVKMCLIVLGVFLLLCVGIWGSIRQRDNSLEYQIEKAQKCVEQEQYEQAITFYCKALELTPDSIELKFSLAEVYFLINNKIEYENLLRDIVDDKNASAEQLECAYGKLVAIYRAKDDYHTINKLLLDSNNETIITKYQNYIAIEPEFSVKEGYYTTLQPLKLTTFGSGKIYFTMDGSDPDENSELYTAPILLENGEYHIKAVYINENGISSDIVSKVYHVEIEELPVPEINAVSGEYDYPISIELVNEEESVFYTTDGSIPTANSTEYTGPIPMPVGQSTFKFIRIEDGRSSEVVERTYTLHLNTDFMPENAVRAVIDYSVETGKIYNANGTFDDTEAAYQYQYQKVIHMKDVDDFYVIAEVFKDVDGTMTKTGNFFAVNVYTGKLNKLQIDSNNNYILVEIL